MSLPRSRSGAVVPATLLAASILLAGCGFTTPEPSRPPATGTASATATTVPTPRPTPTPLPNPIATIALVAAVGETQPGSRSALAWDGVEQAAARLGAASSLTSPMNASELYAAVSKAAGGATSGGAIVVVTAGPAGAQAALTAAQAHPSTQFFVLDQSIADGAPPNVHGLVFDEAEAGYLAGVVARGAGSSATVGFVAGAKTDPAAAAYLAGLADGAREIDAAAKVTASYAGSAQDPAGGRAAVDALAKAGAGAIVASADLTGYGAMRQACVRKLPLVALETDAALLLPDVKPCLVVSILKRYDVAVRDAVVGFATGQPVARVAVGDVAGGELALSDFDNPVPTAVTDILDIVLAAMRSGPPRPTPAPTATPASPPPA